MLPSPVANRRERLTSCERNGKVWDLVHDSCESVEEVAVHGPRESALLERREGCVWAMNYGIASSEGLT
jgi:hypothetical protein